MGAEEIGADRLGHGYAITAHRSQGATVDVAHVLDDGGGRELAYVAMSRARHASHVYTAAATSREAAQSASPGPGTRSDESSGSATKPAPPSASRRSAPSTANSSGASLLSSPTSSPRSTTNRPPSQGTSQISAQAPDGGPIRPSELATRTFKRPGEPTRRTSSEPKNSRRGLLARHRSREDLSTSATTLQAAERTWQQTTEPHARLLEGERSRLAAQIGELEDAQQARADFIKAHPDVVDRISQLHRAIETQQASADRHRSFAKRPPTPPPIMQGRSIRPSHELPPTQAVPTSPEL